MFREQLLIKHKNGREYLVKWAREGTTARLVLSDDKFKLHMEVVNGEVTANCMISTLTGSGLFSGEDELRRLRDIGDFGLEMLGEIRLSERCERNIYSSPKNPSFLSIRIYTGPPDTE